ncbi:hypothetical protein GCM10009087_18050 [Sphingomonas oligophenolica]|uniref:Uncharacterized protein n=1 Tax=Sphingomonas oligophenolica TaxID=301154 RepID=A0ABU9Y3F1_9SPHN
MSKPVLDFDVIRGVTSRLTPAETDLHGAIAANAELMASVIRAGAPMNISPLVTHGVVATLSSANADLVTGMDKTIAVHQQLATLRDDIGLRTVDFGGGLWKGEIRGAPEAAAAEESAPPVHLVAVS